MFDLVFPHMCGACREFIKAAGICEICKNALFELGAGCAVCLEALDEAGRCANCETRPPVFKRLLAAWEYDGVAVEVLLRTKSSGDLTDLKSLVAEFKRTDACRTALGLGFHVAPVPALDAKVRKDGFELTTQIAKWCGFKARWPLRKVRETLAQKGLDRGERELNVVGAFESKPVSGSWLLLDDVVTTGATMNSAAQALLDAGATEVFGLSLARTINLKEGAI
jgi:predicted amidophosphoribosyltransferase